VRRDRDRLLDIAEAIERIQRHTTAGRASLDDELVATWVVHNLQILGEAARRLTPELRGANPEVPWPRIIAMRNILVHEYFGIDADALWAAVEKDLPALKLQVARVLDSLGIAEQ
jgi:uncharacterized protein with HEPN domain